MNKPLRVLAVLLLVGLMAIGLLQVAAAHRTVANSRQIKRVPRDLKPSLKNARHDVPRTYPDRCHAGFAITRSAECYYGNRSSNRTMVLFGDSHAAHWFPAMKKVAESHEWRLLNLTKSACPSVDVPLTQDGEPYTACEKWRRNSIKRIQAERPRFVLLTNGRRSGIPPREWAEGLHRVLEQLKGTTRVVLSDSPRPEVDVPACLSQHRNNPGRCKTPRDKALFRWHTELEKRAARDAGAPFIRSTRWICPDKRCAVIAWRRLMYRDDHHLTATFSRFLSTQLDAALIDKGLLPNSAPDP